MSRPIMDDFVKAISELEPEDYRNVTENALDFLSSKSSTFEEQCKVIRRQLSAIQMKAGYYTKAAKTLAAISVDQLKEEQEQMEHFVKIAQLYLVDEESGLAETYVNKAAALFSDIKDANVKVKFLLCSAQLRDFQHKFLDSARRYYDVSQRVIPEDQLNILTSAIICAILAEAGTIFFENVSKNILLCG